MTAGGGGARKGKREPRPKMSHARNDARYVETGRAPAPAMGPDAGEEPGRMNGKKNGRPYKYPVSPIMTLAALKNYCRLSYRVCQGLAEGRPGTRGAPYFTQIWRRMNAPGVSVSDGIVSVRGRNGVLNLAIDGGNKPHRAKRVHPVQAQGKARVHQVRHCGGYGHKGDTPVRHN